MDKQVRIDLADIEERTQYRDDMSEKLEDMLRKSSKFQGCIVKRVRLEREAPELRNPFDIQYSDGTHAVWLYEWEIQALDEQEILSYLEVQKGREKQLDSYHFWDIISFSVSAIGVIAVFLDLMFMIYLGNTERLILDFLTVALFILGSGLVLVYVNSIRKSSNERWLDTVSAKNDPLFLEALRKLATLSGTGKRELDQYAKRLKEVEKALVRNR
ncbi:MAG: hypothetical protein AM325_014510 [Candidatus Thorarchaeota archaeon SMTZ1-45]|nr:MAG: hypothetical protein AM325_15975 [Candidatus Thorarchaeota archaeon SMTZ1-45]